MIGDGVNDVIALKEANVGVAMQNGSQAARGVADLILLNDSFDALPYAFREGQRIINGMHDILRVFMVRIRRRRCIIAIVVGLGGLPVRAPAGLVPLLRRRRRARPPSSPPGRSPVPCRRSPLPPPGPLRPARP